MSPSTQGRLLVAAQFALVIAIAWPWTSAAVPATAVALGVAGGVVGAWTLVHNRLGNFNIRPEPRATGHLVVTGPYRFVRHPMYVALLLLAAALVVAYADAAKAGCLAALIAVLWGKTVLEERGLRARYPEYAGYAQRVSRFIPGVL
jgi:protein-S-isoprenylcysteine O-methyltransferase Ste14